jgi:hypothetical protein
MTNWYSPDHLPSNEKWMRMLHLLSAHPGPDITPAAVASLARLSRDEAYLALADLRDNDLVTEHRPGRYILNAPSYDHEAAARAGQDDAERLSAKHRLLDHYLQTASVAASVLYPRVTMPALAGPRPGVLPEEICSPEEAEEWFESERHVLLAAMDEAAFGGYRPHAWMLPWVAASFFTDTACRCRLVAVQKVALDVAARHGDLTGRALASLHLGRLRFSLGETEDSCRHLEDAIGFYHDQEDRAGELAALSMLAGQLASLGQLP